MQVEILTLSRRSRSLLKDCTPLTSGLLVSGKIKFLFSNRHLGNLVHLRGFIRQFQVFLWGAIALPGASGFWENINYHPILKKDFLKADFEVIVHLRREIACFQIFANIL